MTTKILFVTTLSLTLRSFLLPYAQHFRSLGWQVDALAAGVSQCQECSNVFSNVWDIHWSRNPVDMKTFWRLPGFLRELVNSEEYDLVHVHTPVAAFITRFSLRTLYYEKKITVVYTAHGFHFYRGGSFVKNMLFVFLEKLAGNWTNYLVVINNEDEANALRFRIVPVSKIWKIPGVGVDTNLFSPERISKEEVIQVREDLGLGRDQPLFLMIAEFNPGKRHRDLVYAFAKLNHPSVCLAFAGIGPEMKSVRTLVKVYGLECRCFFLGYRSDIPALIRSSIATILPSEREGLPVSIMESLSLGVPVIGTDIRGIHELLIGGGGVLVPVGDVDQLSAAMRLILTSPAKGKSMGEKGRQQMKKFYDINKIICEHERLYQLALSDLATNLTKKRQDNKSMGAISFRKQHKKPIRHLFDLNVAVPAMIILAPFFILIGILVRFKIGAPVLFKQQRPGLHGRPFEMIKFRTMTDARDGSGCLLPDEMRLTSFGKLLRSTSLDELPGLWNVVKGDMSLVGPRPLLMQYLARYTPEQARRHEVKPGITGWAQVNGRNALSWEDKLKLDVWYVANWSLKLDLKIIGLTLRSVLRREGISAEGEATAVEFMGSEQRSEI